MLKFCILVLTLFFINIANAQDTLLNLKQQIDRLQREVSDLSKSVFNDISSSSNSKQQLMVGESNLTTFDLRIYDLEKDIKKLNENFEELVFQIDDLTKLYQELNLNLDTKSIISNSSSIDENDNISNISNISNNSLGNLVINSEDLNNEFENDTDQENINLNVTKKLSAEEEFQLALDLLRSQQFDKAKIAFKEFIQIYTSNNLSGSAHYWLGEIYLLKKEYREAALIFAEGFQKHPESVKAPDMLYKLAESLHAFDKKEDACNTLLKFNKEYPDHKLIEKNKEKISAFQCKPLIQ